MAAPPGTLRHTALRSSYRENDRLVAQASSRAQQGNLQHPASNWCWAPLRLALHDYVALSGPPPLGAHTHPRQQPLAAIVCAACSVRASSQGALQSPSLTRRLRRSRCSGLSRSRRLSGNEQVVCILSTSDQNAGSLRATEVARTTCIKCNASGLCSRNGSVSCHNHIVEQSMARSLLSPVIIYRCTYRRV